MQATNRIIMVRPDNFYFNEQTAEDNIYQNRPEAKPKSISQKALAEFDNAVAILRSEGIDVEVLKDDCMPYTPDSIFPNNWFSTHEGKLILYPMYAPNRRNEIDKFKDQLIDIYKPQQIISLIEEGLASQRYLESTGAMVFDRIYKKIYSSLSERSEQTLVYKVAELLEYEPIVFSSTHMGRPVYHTNVILSISTDFAFVALDLIDEKYRKTVYDSLAKNRKVISLSSQNILHYCGNILELQSSPENLLVMSETAYQNFPKNLLEQISDKLKIVHIPVPTIEEVGGGSIRCMMAELF